MEIQACDQMTQISLDNDIKVKVREPCIGGAEMSGCLWVFLRHRFVPVKCKELGRPQKCVTDYRGEELGWENNEPLD